MAASLTKSILMTCTGPRAPSLGPSRLRPTVETNDCAPSALHTKVLLACVLAGGDEGVLSRSRKGGIRLPPKCRAGSRCLAQSHAETPRRLVPAATARHSRQGPRRSHESGVRPLALPTAAACRF